MRLDHTIETVTKANIETLKETVSCVDQRDEFVPGCVTWGIIVASNRGQMTRWPNGRGAVAFGGDSHWGDWETGCNGEPVLVLEDGTTYDEDGAEVGTTN